MGLATHTSSRVFDLFLNQTLQRNGVDRRSFERVNWRATLHVQPVDQDFQPVGPSFCVISSDISRGGIGFIYPEPVEDELVNIGVSDTSLAVLARVTHNTSIGSDGMLYLVGTEFLSAHN